ncbi:MAG: YdcF family protein, partial [Crocinitomicaceae bacterium]
NYDIGIVLSGMMEYNKDVERLSVRRGTDRIWQAITLYKKGKIKKILISGDSGYLVKDGLHEADQMKEVLLSWGIPNEDIIIENQSRNTHENAGFTKALIEKEYPNSSLLLITSALHMKRAKACFDKEGLKVNTFSTDHYSEENADFTLDNLIPSIDAFQLWDTFNKEWVGYVAYWVMGYL